MKIAVVQSITQTFDSLNNNLEISIKTVDLKNIDKMNYIVLEALRKAGFTMGGSSSIEIKTELES